LKVEYTKEFDFEGGLLTGFYWEIWPTICKLGFYFVPLPCSELAPIFKIHEMATNGCKDDSISYWNKKVKNDIDFLPQIIKGLEILNKKGRFAIAIKYLNLAV
jgi:hypothetical protein